MKSTSYSAKTLDHFRNPRNVGTLDGDDIAVGRVGNPVCGDLMDIYIQVVDERIADIRFQTFGCGSAVATSSMITELVKGMTLDDALTVTRSDVADALDGLPPIKMHCSNLAADALHAAIENWRAGVRPEEVTSQVATPACEAGAAIAQKLEEASSGASEGKHESAADGGGKGELLGPGGIAGLDDFAGSGAFTTAAAIGGLEGQRVVVVDGGDPAAELAVKLAGSAGRVVFMTPGKDLAGLGHDVRAALKTSDVKILYEAQPLQVLGEGEVERILVHDLNEDEEYELAADAIVVLE